MSAKWKPPRVDASCELTEELAIRLAEHAAEGCGYAQMADKCGIPLAYLEQWVERGRKEWTDGLRNTGYTNLVMWIDHATALFDEEISSEYLKRARAQDNRQALEATRKYLETRRSRGEQKASWQPQTTWREKDRERKGPQARLGVVRPVTKK